MTIPNTYWNGQPVHGPTTHAQGTLSRDVGLAVDHYLPGSWIADKKLGLNREIQIGRYSGTPLDEITVVGAWLVVLLAVLWLLTGD